jgi:hypothetical protein
VRVAILFILAVSLRAQAPVVVCTVAAPCIWLYQGGAAGGAIGVPLFVSIHLRAPQVFAIAAPTSVVTASNAPFWGAYMVWRNGLLLAPALDYTVAGQVLTLNAACGSGDVLQVW